MLAKGLLAQRPPNAEAGGEHVFEVDAPLHHWQCVLADRDAHTNVVVRRGRIEMRLEIGRNDAMRLNVDVTVLAPERPHQVRRVV